MSLEKRLNKFMADTNVKSYKQPSSVPNTNDLEERFKTMFSDAQKEYKEREYKTTKQEPKLTSSVQPKYFDSFSVLSTHPTFTMPSYNWVAPADKARRSSADLWNKTQSKILSQKQSYDSRKNTFDRQPSINFGEGDPSPQMDTSESYMAFNPRAFSKDIAKTKGKDNAFVNSILKPAMASYHQQKRSDLIGEKTFEKVGDYGLIDYNEQKAKDYEYKPNKSLIGRGVQGVSGVVGQQAANMLSKEFFAGLAADMLGAGGYGSKIALAKNSFDAQAGQLYDDLVQQGVDPGAAYSAAGIGGGINAALELAQLDELAKGAKTVLGKGSQKVTQELAEKGTKAALKQGLKSWGKETAEEQLQENVSMMAEDWARRKSGLSGYSAKDYLNRNLETLPENAMTMALLGAPNTVGTIGRAKSGHFDVNRNDNANSRTTQEEVKANAFSGELDTNNVEPKLTEEPARAIQPKEPINTLSADDLDAIQTKNLDTFSKIGNKLNVEVEFFSGNPNQNGIYRDGKVMININSPRAMENTFAHEVYHFLRAQDRNEKLNTFENFLLNNSATLLKNDSPQNAIENKVAEYRQYGVDLTLYDAKEEVFAEAVGRLFDDEKAIQHLYKTDRNLFQRMYDWIVHTISKIGKDADTKLLMDAQRKFVVAMQESSGVLRENAEQNDMNAFIGNDKIGLRAYETDYPNISGSKLIDKFKADFAEMFDNQNVQVDIKGKKVRIVTDENTIGENIYKNIEHYNSKYEDPKNIVRSKYQSDLADILETAEYVNTADKRGIPPKNKNHEGVDFIHTFVNTVNLGGTPTDIVFTIFQHNDGTYSLYYVNPIINWKESKKLKKALADKGNSLNALNATDVDGAVTNAFSNDSVTRDIQTVNTQSEKYSFDDGTTPPMNFEYAIDSPSRQQKVRSVFETASESGRVAPEIRENILQNIKDKASSVMYDVVSNKETINKAKRILETQGVEQTQAAIEHKIATNQILSLDDLAIAIGMVEHYSQIGDLEKSEELIADLAVIGTETGRKVQILSLLKKQTPQGALLTVEKKLQRINSRLKTDQQITLSDNAKADILSSKVGTEDLKRAVANTEAEIYEKMPSTWWDKWNAWRYLSMLGNPKTHIRNIVGNLFFTAQKAQKDIFGAVAESMIAKTNPTIERTKTLAPVDKNLKAVANQLFIEYKDELTGDGKENANLHQRVFKTKALEKARKLNSKILEAEDVFFLQGHFKQSLTKFLKANKVKAEDIANIVVDRQGKRMAQMKQLTGDKAAILDKGIQYAIEEAQKATFRDRNQIASVISMAKTRNKYLQMGVDSLFPFTKTPLNIMRRGYEYSPLGVVEGFRKLYQKAKGDDVTTADIIDAFAVSASGTTTVFALGMALAQAGFVTGNEEDDEKQINDLENNQNYALQIGDYSFTLDWAAPLSLPFFLGVEAYNVMQGKSAGEGAIRLTDSITKLSDPMINMSMLQGLNRSFNEIKYAKTNAEAVGNVVATNISGYINQGVPTFMGQIARSMDDVRRTKYVDKNSFIPRMAQQFKNDVQSKVPYWSQKAPAYIDPFGREQKTGDIFFRVAQNMLLPGFLNKKESNAVTQELRNLYEYTGDKSVLPKKAERQIDGKYGKKFTAKEYEAYNKTRGQKTETLLTELVSDQGYKQMTENERARMVENVYQYSKALADNKHLGKPLEKRFAEIEHLEKDGMKYTDIATADLFRKQFKEATSGDKVEAAKLNPFRNLSLKGEKREKYILSQMSDSAQRKYKHLKARGVSDPDTYFITYMVATSQSGEDRTKEEKVRDLMRLGYAEGQAWAIYSILNSTSKKWQ